MATLFKRLTHYCRIKHKELPTLEERQIIGKQILEYWFSQYELRKPLHYKPSPEPEQTYKVVSYPNEFIPIIDSIIDKYFKEKSPPVKKERKKIPINRTPENKRFKQFLKPNK